MVSRSPPTILNPFRQARLRVAFDDAVDAYQGELDDPEFTAKVRDVVDLHARLEAEQLAEFGYLPTTVAGCVAVLDVAARILELVRPTA